MKRIIICILLIFSFRGYAQTHTGSWNGIEISSDSLTRVGFLIFADSAAGYMGCTYEPHVGSFTQRWYRTLNGGLSWTPLTFNGNPLPQVGFGGQICTPTQNSVFLFGAAPYIFRSLDNGDHWDTVRTILDPSKFFTMFTEKYGVGVQTQNIQKPSFMQTFDGGNSFSPIHFDSLFSASILANPDAQYGAKFSSELHGTYLIEDINKNNGNGLTSLITSNGGYSWEKHYTNFQGYENYDVSGGIQYEKGTSNLWMLPGSADLNTVISNSRAGFYRAWPDFNINYCFSTDYGVTWGYDTTFTRKSSTFYGVSPGNIWMTLHDGIEVNGLIPSYKIAHTIDFGKTWDIDVSTLNNDVKYDAQAMYFTDENHGWIVAIHDGMPYILIYHPVKNSVVEHFISARKQLPVFPVPAIDQVTINLSEGTIPIQAQVFDIIGRQYFPSYKIINNLIQLDTHDLPAGIWLTIVKHTYGSNTTRFILQK